MKDKLIAAISIDDVCPKEEFRILGDTTEKWLRLLNEKYGAKFTCFVPSNYHNQFPLSQHKEWAQELASIDWIELAAHGHLHMTSDPKQFGECEFFELQSEKDVLARLRRMFDEWNAIDYLPVGWKSPGWLTSQNTASLIPTQIDYASVHNEHSSNVRWGRSDFKIFKGHDGIHQTDISIHNVSEKYPMGMIMFTSHIAGDWNDNVWNEKNFEQLKLSLEYLTSNYDCEFKTLKECV
jgi:peptidoglycan/xylan/chitin deacetylase (PgdA/CDA1 family)